MHGLADFSRKSFRCRFEKVFRVALVADVTAIARFQLWICILSQLAPFFGDVVSINHKTPQVCYRIHGNNDYFDDAYFDAGDLPLEKYADIAIEMWATCCRANELLDRLELPHTPINIELHEHFMRLQLICRRSHPAIFPERDSLYGVLRKYWRAVSRVEAPWISKGKWIMWSVLISVGPRPIYRWAVRAQERRTEFRQVLGELKRQRSS